MKKTLYIILFLIFASALAILVFDIWSTTRTIQLTGRAGSLKIERQYNASRWSSPVPIKKIHAYTATFAPNYPVIVETEQQLVAGREYFIQFVTREQAQAVRDQALRPIAGSVRLRLTEDGNPSGVASTAAMDTILAKAMGDAPAAGVTGPAEATVRNSVPFLFGGVNDSTLELIWNNSAFGEWAVLVVLLLLTKVMLINAWFTPLRARRVKADRTDFVHPSLRRIDADEPPAQPQRIAIAPRPVAVKPEESGQGTPPGTPSHPPLKLPRK